MSNFGDADYWENRYSAEEGQRYEWLEDYQSIKEPLHSAMTKGKQTKILHIGCGNSELQDKLYEEGYHHIHNNDISTVVIKQLKLTSKYPELVYEVMDITEMTYKDKSFDLVLDKSTIDALLCSDAPSTNVAKMLHHIYRVLADDGFYVVISYGKPVQRLMHLQRKHINFQYTIHEILGKSGSPPHYIYIGKKVPREHQEELYQQVLKQVEQEDQQEIVESQKNQP